MKNYLKELIEENGIEILPLRPKHFVPKGEYVEMTRGIGIDYTECIVPKHEVQAEIAAGWSISRLSKLSPSLVNAKWANSIIMLESQ